MPMSIEQKEKDDSDMIYAVFEKKPFQDMMKEFEEFKASLNIKSTLATLHDGLFVRIYDARSQMGSVNINSMAVDFELQVRIQFIPYVPKLSK